VKLTLENDIYNFIKCPRYYKLSRQYKYPISPKLDIIESVIRKAYTRRTQLNRCSEWRSLVGWVDKKVFKKVDINNEEAFEASRRLSEEILVFLQKWYTFDYVRSLSPVYINTGLLYELGANVVVGKVPFLEADEVPTITYFGEKAIDNLKIRSDIRATGWAAYLIEELNLEAINVRHLHIGPDSGILVEPATIKRLKCKEIKEIIHEVAACIAADISYPSFTEMCSSCEFHRKCKI